MVMASLRILVVGTMTMTSAGCFDVSGGQGAPLLIDDFDSNTLLPADPHFDQWRCGKFEPKSEQGCTCGYDARTYRSKPKSMRLQAEIRDSPDGDPDFGGAQVYTQATVPVDLSHVRRIAFDAMLAPVPYSILPGATLFVELHCSLAPSKGVPLGGLLYVQHAVTLPGAEEWRSYVVDVTEGTFAIPKNYPDAEIIGGLPACIKRVDGIHFSVNARLQDGETGIVDLHIDDLYLE
jgi:hypothetical protein